MWRRPSHSPFLCTLRSSVAASARVMVGFLWVDTQVLWYRSHSEPAGQQWTRSEQQTAWKKRSKSLQSMIVWKWELNLKYCISSHELLSWAFTATTFILWVFVLSATDKLLYWAELRWRTCTLKNIPVFILLCFWLIIHSFWSTVQLILIFQSNDDFTAAF